ncbi:MAG: hypothetical protein IJK38_09705 [Oscillospiraceae bacterium]|nr:hypothetical protein [Oscillospiraceae bacterium]
MVRNLSEQEVQRIAEEAAIIVCGYAFTARADGLINILNLYHPDCTMVVNKEAEVIETSMDPIGQQIVLKLCRKNLKFMDEYLDD